MLAPVLPRHVRACQHSPSALERWFIYVWSRASSEKKLRVPYCCNSWRCETCRRHEASVSFARIKQACAPLDPSGWVFLVLTLDRDGYYGGKPWVSPAAAYDALGKMTRATLDRIGRAWGPDTKLEGKKRRRARRTVGNRWFSTVEAHRSGWPHVNLVVWCPELASLLRRDRDQRMADPEVADAVALAQDAWKRREPVPESVRAVARRATLIGDELREITTAAGWGLQSTADARSDIETLIGYTVKLAALHDSAIGEVAKVTQLPMNARERFRRLRSGKGFLPPRHKSANMTGCLVRRVRRWDTTAWNIEQINPPKDPAQLAAIDEVRRAELALIAEERAILSRVKVLPAMPPIRVVMGATLESHKQTSKRSQAPPKPLPGDADVSFHEATVYHWGPKGIERARPSPIAAAVSWAAALDAVG